MILFRRLRDVEEVMLAIDASNEDSAPNDKHYNVALISDITHADVAACIMDLLPPHINTFLLDDLPPNILNQLAARIFQRSPDSKILIIEPDPKYRSEYQRLLPNLKIDFYDDSEALAPVLGIPLRSKKEARVTSSLPRTAGSYNVHEDYDTYTVAGQEVEMRTYAPDSDHTIPVATQGHQEIGVEQETGMLTQISPFWSPMDKALPQSPIGPPLLAPKPKFPSPRAQLRPSPLRNGVTVLDQGGELVNDSLKNLQHIALQIAQTVEFPSGPFCEPWPVNPADGSSDVENDGESNYIALPKQRQVPPQLPAAATQPPVTAQPLNKGDSSQQEPIYNPPVLLRLNRIEREALYDGLLQRITILAKTDEETKANPDVEKREDKPKKAIPRRLIKVLHELQKGPYAKPMPDQNSSLSTGFFPANPPPKPSL